MKIDREKMLQIGEAVEKREEMRRIIRSNYGNDVLARRFGVNIRTIEKLAALHRPEQGQS
jgi:phage baseplate assembly protein W